MQTRHERLTALVREIKDAICAVSELKNNDNDHKLGV